MNRIDAITQYSSPRGNLQFIHQKKDIIYSSFFTVGAEEPIGWSERFSKSPNSTGFLLVFVYE